jgi:methionine-R-sulfoxide reductase
MPRATPNGVLVLSLAGMAVVLCAGLAVVIQFGKTEIKKHARDAAAKAPAPAGPYAARIRELTPKQFAATQTDIDDYPGLGAFVNTTEPGLYLDVVSGEVLFASQDKLESTEGFAEFSKPFDPSRLDEKNTTVLGEPRLEVRSKLANSRLGWITTDPATGTRRYVINSSALRFVPARELEANGLESHRSLFPEPAAPPGEK